jgi:hypothetical protein
VAESVAESVAGTDARATALARGWSCRAELDETERRETGYEGSDILGPGIKTIIFPVNDLAGAQAPFRDLPGVEPYADEPYYVGFKAGDQEIGLDPTATRRA